MFAFLRRHKILTALLLIVLLCGGCLFARTRGPHHGYTLDFLEPAPGTGPQPGRLDVGVAKREITVNMDNYDPWVDVNENGKYDPDADTYTDRNGNGRFDGIWIAGFGTNRPAKAVNDPQWARALALRNNGVTVVLVSVDAIGLFHNDVIDIRELVDPGLNIDHIVVSSTHCHEVPDTMKIWSFWKRVKGLDIPLFGFDHRYIDNLKRQAAAAVEEAVRGLQPCDMYCATLALPEQGFIEDTRKPHVIDTNAYLWRFTKPGTEETIATFVNWGNHPETLGGRNCIVSSDFCHYLREGVENGVPEPNGVEGLGGTCVYMQGMIGGLMTQLHIEVPHCDGVRKFKEDGFEKTEALGQNVAIEICKALRDPAQVWKNESPLVAVAAKTFLAPMSGHFKWGIMLGLIHRGYYAGGRAKTEANLVRIGDVLVLTVPGELYSEIVQGGVEALPGRDFEVKPLESPSLRSLMAARQNLVVGLANDEIGYIIPKSQWDAEAPFVYNGKDQYGEENSPGPDVAFAWYSVAKELLNRMYQAHPFS